ncbi:lipid-A-disaccharide synthase N-terminal domain-containing protein [Histidinibacterium lentulum]|uniref:Lipid A biosynthesis protein n=1 Tax=Histidinibacterium lentulum TaxID=2480588 RepID=A0A3N2QYS1_9RHOB|nr:lipid-A-disaccharide synthase N-terminal domain-containing protein [Histidinibacterium lentulum]ROU00339.1 lipid A biosynthesis protein [Histidinibacterium lentulum]
MLEALKTFLHVDSTAELTWVAVGLIGQLAFTARFLVQWIASERIGRSTIPVAFWYCSIVGGAILLSYAIYRRDPVFILGQSMGVLIYARNLWLIRRERLETQ